MMMLVCGVLTGLSKGAFGGCSGLTSVTIGNGVTSIDYGAFDECGGLEKVYFKGSAEEWDKISIDSSNDYLSGAARYYYSKSEPGLNESHTDYVGKFWRYDQDGFVKEWIFQGE